MDITKKLKELNLKLHGKGNPSYALLGEVVCSETKLLLIIEEVERVKLLHFENLKQHRDVKNATMNTKYLSITINETKDGFAERFEQFETNVITLAFIVKPPNTNLNNINIELFGIETEAFQMQFLDLETKHLWSGKITERKIKLEVLEVHVTL